jgi:hypothetical protein
MEKKKIKIKKRLPVVFCGSLVQQNFGESIHNHGFLSWDMETLTYTEHNIETEYGFYQFKISSIEDIDNDKEILTNY